ncbi:RDD family protein [Faecalibacter rhinopitheci]|uniref:RDD family protein n=1 Tax=Faecalibacter rhinopitheci TaxID=2779678 RepID=A0A8J7FRE9_9FLAO|nr:RDD family protein [Faecalibacter rhinopitheci]MBF0597118.1 RDD family protein [Faecalibacter rhinopitheci]MBQ0146934.1 RDD family protein [Candidatus Onthonaster equi]
MNKLLVNTPQNVQIEYNVSVLGSRILAFIIDIIIRITYLIVAYKFISYFKITDEWLNLGIYSLITLPVLLYGVILETLMNGQTIGKWITKIRVVQMDGEKASFYNYFARWLIGIFEINLTFGAVAFITIAINKNGQRLGDLAANTVLISLKPQLDLHQTIFNDLAENYLIKFPEVAKLSDRDINIINDNFQTALKSNNFELLEALTRKIEEITGVKSDGMGFIDFIQRIIQDHYHFHRNK